MQIRRWRPESGTNFGDELNTYIWPRLLPATINQLPGTFYGIGTLLGEGMKTAEKPRIVFGAGTGYSKPEIPERIYFVRGPHTAATFGGCPWITDPGLLVHHFAEPRARGFQRVPCAFMPRWDAVPKERGPYIQAGIEVIDPRMEVEVVINAIRHTNLLLTETLHGAVVADALRVPWVSIYGSRGHEKKWQDWTASMDMIWSPIDAAEFSLSWARDYAVPQLSALSVLDTRKRQLDNALIQLQHDIREGNL